MTTSSTSLQRLLRLALASLLFGLFSATGVAQQAGAQSPRVVLKGYDPVAYFTMGRAMKGSPEFGHDWDGGRYYFTSMAHRDKFAADPERYAPQFGGYCTGSMSRKVRNEADPEAWIISEGKLYVFGAARFAEQARKDPGYLSSRIPLAVVNWQETRAK